MQLSCREQWLDPEQRIVGTLWPRLLQTRTPRRTSHPLTPISLDPFPVLSLLILPLLPSSSLTTSSHCIEVKMTTSPSASVSPSVAYLVPSPLSVNGVPRSLLPPLPPADSSISPTTQRREDARRRLLHQHHHSRLWHQPRCYPSSRPVETL